MPLPKTTEADINHRITIRPPARLLSNPDPAWTLRDTSLQRGLDRGRVDAGPYGLYKPPLKNSLFLLTQNSTDQTHGPS